MEISSASRPQCARRGRWRGDRPSYARRRPTAGFFRRRTRLRCAQGYLKGERLTSASRDWERGTGSGGRRCSYLIHTFYDWKSRLRGWIAGMAQFRVFLRTLHSRCACQWRGGRRDSWVAVVPEEDYDVVVYQCGNCRTFIDFCTGFERKLFFFEFGKWNENKVSRFKREVDLFRGAEHSIIDKRMLL